MILTTICYLKKDHKTLLLHRIKKENDINEGKWIGIGGKIEKGESPIDCIKREVFEESGYILNKINYVGFITFPNIYHGEDEGMFLFTSDDFSGEMIQDCHEGNLKWIDDTKIKELPMWEGDRYFFEWFDKKNKILAKFSYENDKLIEKDIFYIN